MLFISVGLVYRDVEKVLSLYTSYNHGLAMCVLRIFLEGFTSIFNPPMRRRDPEIERLEKLVESYRTMSERERLARDWQAVQGDMGRAWQRIRMNYGQE